ncbi:MAG TPA: hypothetical protein QGI72_04630 [Poseidonia sp.]|nr:hypothetical protein [Poseidonia sp.]
MLSEPESSSDLPSPMGHHKESWDQHELLGSALSSYFDILQHTGGRWPSWKVAYSGDLSIHERLLDANRHLEKLGWMAKLTSDEGWTITAFPLPERQFPRINSVLFFWGLSFLTLSLAGDIWMNSARPDEGWFSSSSFVDAVIGYTLPIMVFLLIASFIQTRIARRFGVRSGHIMPVPDLTIALYAMGIFPSSWLFWPFGILLIPTMPRMDARPWPNRASLGYTALSVPIVLMVSGMTLLFAGISLTPQYLELSSMPLLTSAPSFIALIAMELIHDDAMIRMAWAHPWVHAGGMLMLFAWISILPIPTFPGGRLIIARMGVIDARSSGTQSLLLVTVLLFAFLFDVFDNFSLWFLILGLILPLLFFLGNDLRIPFILDENEGLSEQDHRRMGTLLLISLLLFLPAQQPVLKNDSWDDDLQYVLEAPEAAILGDDGTWFSYNTVEITNPSSIQKPYAIDVFFEQSGHDWEVEWICDDQNSLTLNGKGCGSNLLPGRTAKFWINYSWSSTEQPLVSNLTYVIEMNDEYYLETQTLKPGLEIAASDHWYDIFAGGHVKRCVDLHGQLLESPKLNVSVGESQIAGMQTTLVQIDGQSGMEANHETTPSSVCLRGLDPLVFQPPMSEITLNNDTFKPLMPENYRPLEGMFPEEGWTIGTNDEEIPGWGSLLIEGGVLQVGNDFCPINPKISTPSRPFEGPWIWDTSVFKVGALPVVESGQNLTLVMAEGTNASLCSNSERFDPYPRLKFDVHEGPEMLVEWMNTTTRFWTTPIARAFNGTMMNQNMGELSFINPGNESIPFRIAREGGVGDDWLHDWDGQYLAPGVTNLSLLPPSEPYSTMWITHEAGTVVLHLASYQ